MTLSIFLRLIPPILPGHLQDDNDVLVSVWVSLRIFYNLLELYEGFTEGIVIVICTYMMADIAS